MSNAAPTAVELVQKLTVEDIRQRLDANEAERQSLLVLLRAAQAATRKRKRPQVQTEGDDA